MRIHKEGLLIILVVLAIVVSLNFIFFWLVKNSVLQSLLIIASTIFFLLVIWFFRNPSRVVTPDDSLILSPADGEVVVIEETVEKEYFKDKRLQVSIFMSPVNVHANRYPISGVTEYVKYHAGKYLVAWHPKSSELNERNTIVIKDKQGHEILVRQIAGAVARRIVSYASVGKYVVQGDELGFIKFGSRVDIFLPLTTKVDVKLDQKVKGNLTILGRFN